MTTLPLPVLAVLGLVAGGVLGAVYFGLLRLAVRRQADGGSPRAVVGLSLLRFAVAVAGFWAMAQAGALPLLLALLGFLAARGVVRRRLEAAR